MTEAPQTLTVRVPFAIRKRGGRRLVIAPGGAETSAPVRHRVDNAMVKALARGFRWRKLLETDVYGTIDEIAAAEKINSSYVGRLLRLTLLAPEFVEAILDGRQPVEMTLAALMEPFAVAWEEQRHLFASARSADIADGRSPPRSAHAGREARQRRAVRLARRHRAGHGPRRGTRYGIGPQHFSLGARIR